MGPKVDVESTDSVDQSATSEELNQTSAEHYRFTQLGGKLFCLTTRMLCSVSDYNTYTLKKQMMLLKSFIIIEFTIYIFRNSS